MYCTQEETRLPGERLLLVEFGRSNKIVLKRMLIRGVWDVETVTYLGPLFPRVDSVFELAYYSRGSVRYQKTKFTNEPTYLGEN